MTSLRRNFTNAFETELEPSMDPMTDVVFLLLVFFIFTFQVRAYEILVPVEAESSEIARSSTPLEPIPQIYLEANPHGELNLVRVDDTPLRSLDELAAELSRRLPNRSDEHPVLTMWPSPDLKYRVLIDALRCSERAGWDVKLGPGKEPTNETP